MRPEGGGQAVWHGRFADPAVDRAVSLAGCVGERLFCPTPSPIEGSRTDLERVRRGLRGATALQREALLGQTTAWLERRLRPYQSKVLTAAKALDYFGKLDGKQLERLLQVKADDAHRPKPRALRRPPMVMDMTPKPAPKAKAKAKPPLVIRVLPAPKPKRDKAARAIARGLANGTWIDRRGVR